MTDHLVPAIMILMCVVFAAIASYAAPRGEWAVAVYADGKNDAFHRAAGNVNEIADIYPRINGALVRVGDDTIKNNLRRSGAFLLDPMGVPLCTRPQTRL